MTRFARIVIPGCPHHVTQRGNHQQTVFFTDDERFLYLALARKYFALYQIRVVGYVLMPNHVHYLLIPGRPTSLAKGVGRLHNDFARWQQIERNLTGHLWQNRFFSCPLDEQHFWEALRYIELNPVRARLVRYPWDWPWSSAYAHANGIDDTGWLDMECWKSGFDPSRWRIFLQGGIDSPCDHEPLRLATRTGRPYGSNSFIDKLEELTGRLLRPKKRGPPPRNRSPLATEFRG
jgi:putative transposase